MQAKLILEERKQKDKILGEQLKKLSLDIFSYDLPYGEQNDDPLNPLAIEAQTEASVSENKKKKMRRGQKLVKLGNFIDKENIMTKEEKEELEYNERMIKRLEQR